jgi:hypothetical protein
VTRQSPSFELVDDPGVKVHDPIERRQCVLATPEPVTLADVDPDRFYFPVTSAVSFETTALELPTVFFSPVRNAAGEMLAEIGTSATETFSGGEYIVELSAPVKLYLRVVGPMTVTTTDADMRIDFDGRRRVELGARSYHDSPAATVTTTTEPRDLMRAVSTLGSALKTTSPERSYPTLRGHPPEIELGDRFHAPDDVTPPETGVRIEVPADLRSIFGVATLAHYLGARVVPGDRPRIVTDTGFTHPLDGPGDLFATVSETLEHVFFLDCLTRNEGYYDVPLYERQRASEAVDLDFADLYGRSIPEQLEAYLSVPHDRLAPFTPTWRLTSDVVPSGKNVELLPFVVNELAHIRCPRSYTASESPRNAIIDEFTRRSGGQQSPGGETTTRRGPRPDFVQPEPADSMEQVWAGEGCPVGASKALVEGYRNRFRRPPTDDDLDIVVVCNDAAMTDEVDSADTIYRSRDDLAFDITEYHELSRGAFREVLAADTDFLHYIGHVDEEGFECSDGFLDARNLDHVGVDAFLLNACRSYDQGLALVERGSFGGVVTLSDVSNAGAGDVGELLARLLNHGFGMRSALNVVRDHSFVGNQYIVVGDGGGALTQFQGTYPVVISVADDGDGYRMELTSYPPTNHGMGSISHPLSIDTDEFELAVGRSRSFEMGEEQLREFMQLGGWPVVYRGELQWSTEFFDS